MQSEAIADENGWLGFANEQSAQGSVARGNMFMPHSLRLGGNRTALRTGPCQRATVAALRRAAGQARTMPTVRPRSREARRAGTRSTATPRTRTASSSTTYSTTHTIAIDVKTGKKAWRTKLGDVEHGETMSRGPFLVRQQGVRRQPRRQARRARLPCRAHVDTASRSGAPTARTARAAKACSIAAYSSAGIADVSHDWGKWTLCSGTNLGQRDQEKPANANTVQ